METVFDKRGIPILRGDIVKVFHFVGARRKRHYMYKQCLGLNSYKPDGPQYVFFSHLNFIEDIGAKEGPYHEHIGSHLRNYEIVDSINADHEERARVLHGEGE